MIKLGDFKEFELLFEQLEQKKEENKKLQDLQKLDLIEPKIDEIEIKHEEDNSKKKEKEEEFTENAETIKISDSNGIQFINFDIPFLYELD